LWKFAAGRQQKQGLFLFGQKIIFLKNFFSESVLAEITKKSNQFQTRINFYRFLDEIVSQILTQQTFSCAHFCEKSLP
jgi:hypothetical protein